MNLVTHTLNKWTNSLVNNKFTEDKLARFKQQKEAVGNNRQDMSRMALENLLNSGYNLAKWDSGMSTHSVCIELNDQVWNLDEFISGLEHDAPIFEKSHPGDSNCTVIVVGDNVPPVRVDSYGAIEEV